jgi:hypothetical protein
MRGLDYGAKYEILVDGKSRSMRDAKDRRGRFDRHHRTYRRQHIGS